MTRVYAITNTPWDEKWGQSEIALQNRSSHLNKYNQQMMYFYITTVHMDLTVPQLTIPCTM